MNERVWLRFVTPSGSKGTYGEFIVEETGRLIFVDTNGDEFESASFNRFFGIVITDPKTNKVATRDDGVAFLRGLEFRYNGPVFIEREAKS